MRETIYKCDVCKNDYTPVNLVPVKRGEVIKRPRVHLEKIEHPKDVSYYSLYPPFYNFLDLCPRCEELVKRVINL